MEIIKKKGDEMKIILDGNCLNYGGTVLNRVEVAEADAANGMVIMRSGHQYYLEPSVVRGWFADIMDMKKVAQSVTDCNQPVTNCNGLKAEKEVSKKFITQDRETGMVIDEFNTLEEAQAAIDRYEAEDRDNNCYTPNFYEVKEVE